MPFKSRIFDAIPRAPSSTRVFSLFCGHCDFSDDESSFSERTPVKRFIGYPHPNKIDKKAKTSNDHDQSLKRSASEKIPVEFMIVPKRLDSPPNNKRRSHSENSIARQSAASDSGADFSPEKANVRERAKTYDEFGFATDKAYSLDTKEQEREIKWSKMIFPLGQIGNSDMRSRNRYWEKVVIKSWKKKLKSRVRKGIPNVFRGEAWVHISGARNMRLLQPNVYRSINRDKCQFEDQIWKDIRRSYRSHSCYEQDYSGRQESLYNVLCAYSIYNTGIGYNQGMSFVCSLLLLYMDEEDAFWMMHVLATNPMYAMEGVWSSQMPMVKVRFDQFEHFLRRFDSKVYKKLEQHFISPGMYQATQWFVTVFLATDLPHHTLLRIWDVFLHDGIKAIFRVGLALIRSKRSEILKTRDELELLEVLKTCVQGEHKNLIEESCKIAITRKQILQQDSAHSVE